MAVRMDQSTYSSMQGSLLFEVGAGTDVMILKIFLVEKFCKNIGVFAQSTASFCKQLIITSVFVRNANFFVENGQKSRKIVIITSTPVLIS
jgi:hypothetical protein